MEAMIDALELVAALLLAFPLGMGFTLFLRWLSRQKRDPREQRSMAARWNVIGTFGVPFSLIMALLRAFHHDANGVESYLVQCAFFISMYLGARTQARRQERDS